MDSETEYQLCQVAGKANKYTRSLHLVLGSTVLWSQSPAAEFLIQLKTIGIAIIEILHQTFVLLIFAPSPRI